MLAVLRRKQQNVSLMEIIIVAAAIVGVFATIVS